MSSSDLSPTDVLSHCNLAVLIGTLARPGEARLLPDGQTIWELDVAIRSDGRAAATVPVSWVAPLEGKSPGLWAVGESLLIVGAVRRRFYRAGGATVSRTDVVASGVVLTRQRRRVALLLAKALGQLPVVESPPVPRRGDMVPAHG